MATESVDKRSERLPRELERSAPRLVKFSIAGIWFAVMLAVFAVGAPAGAIVLWTRSEVADALGKRLRSEGATVQGRVTNVDRPRHENPRTTITYVYEVGGRTYEGRVKLQRKDNKRFLVGSGVNIRYLSDQPGRGWVAGYEPQQAPWWPFALAVTAAALLVLLGTRTLQRQAAMLRDGRAAMARITSVKKRSDGSSTTWRVEYEWMLLSGAMQKGRTEKSRRPPAVGASVPVLYDRDRPSRNALYPLLFVKAAEW